MRAGWGVLVFALACGGADSNPPTTESSCSDGADEDEDQLVDCDDDDCAQDAACAPVVELCTGGVDEDSDNRIDCEDDECFADPACYDFDDPSDLPGPDGDPSLDLDKAGVELTAGTATFFVTVDGPWPPPTDTFAWFLYFEIDNDGNSPVAAVTLQRDAGVEETLPFGVPAANVTVRQTPRGVWARMTGIPATGVKFYIESRVLKTEGGTRVSDTVVSAPADLP